MDLVPWARGRAEELLAEPLPGRWAHTQGVGRLAELLAKPLALGIAADIVCHPEPVVLATGADDRRPEPAVIATGADDRRPEPVVLATADDRRPEPAVLATDAADRLPVKESVDRPPDLLRRATAALNRAADLV
jgi:hypothetical protein